MKQFLSRLIMATLIMSMLPISSAFAASPQQEVVNLAKGFLGVPYKSGGTSPSGFDCSGFVIYIFDKMGISLPRTSADQYTVGKAVSKSDLSAGDMVFFEKTTSKPGITHAGIYVGDNQFISATSSKGIKIDSLSSSYWGPKYVGAKRILEDAPVAPGEFRDLPTTHLAYTAIHTLNDQNIIKGFNDQTFQPDNPVTRGQAAAIINRVLNKEPNNIQAFKDVSTTHSFARDIAAMKELGIISGFNDGTYRPDDHMTRAEMAVIVERAFKLNELQTIAQASHVYTDVAPGYWAHDAIVALQQIDTTSIFSGERYHISNKATRAVFSAAIYNSMNATN